MQSISDLRRTSYWFFKKKYLYVCACTLSHPDSVFCFVVLIFAPEREEAVLVGEKRRKFWKREKHINLAV